MPHMMWRKVNENCPSFTEQPRNNEPTASEKVVLLVVFSPFSSILAFRYLLAQRLELQVVSRMSTVLVVCRREVTSINCTSDECAATKCSDTEHEASDGFLEPVSNSASITMIRMSYFEYSVERSDFKEWGMSNPCGLDNNYHYQNKIRKGEMDFACCLQVFRVSQRSWT